MGAFLGKQLPPKAIAELCWKQGWRDLDLVKIVATCLAESQGYTRAYNDNVRDGKTDSRDVGLFQINIRARHIGTRLERDLYDPVRNVQAARKLFDTRMTLTKRRRFQPWYAYTLGWATFPEWWVWSVKRGEWVETGLYLQKAVRGVANMYADKFGHQGDLVYLREKPARPRFTPRDVSLYRPRINTGQ
jgi:lysozyme-like protein